MMRKTAIIECPSNLGLHEPKPGKEPGVSRLPDHLRTHGFHGKIRPQEVLRLPAPKYTMNVHAPSGVRNAAAISSYAETQAVAINEAWDKGLMPIVLGGDCSIVIGNALACKQRGRYGLFYLDGHSDFMLPNLSSTAAAAGMDLAFVAGRGHPILSDIQHLSPYIEEQYICCAGNRDYDEAYVAYIKESSVDYWDVARLEQEGFIACANGFLALVEKEKLDGFWLHIDVDVLHNDLMPAVDSPEPGGISYTALAEITGPLFASGKLSGIDITILDPDLDQDGKYATEFIKVFHQIFLK